MSKYGSLCVTANTLAKMTSWVTNGRAAPWLARPQYPQ